MGGLLATLLVFASANAFSDDFKCHNMTHEEMVNSCAGGRTYSPFDRIENDRDWDCDRKFGFIPTYRNRNVDYEIGVSNGNLTIFQRVLYTGLENSDSATIDRTKSRLESAFAAHRAFLNYHGIDANITYSLRMDVEEHVNEYTHHVTVNLNLGCGRHNASEIFLFENKGMENCAFEENLKFEKRNQISFNRLLVHELLHTLNLNDEYFEEGKTCKPYQDRKRPRNVVCPNGGSCTNIMQTSWERRPLRDYSIAKDSFYRIIKPLCKNMC